MSRFPDDNMAPNVYGSTRGNIAKWRIADAFRAAGWDSRNCAWDDYEIENEFSELIIEGGNTGSALIHGCVLDPDQNILCLGGVLASLGLGWQFELYGEDDELVKEYESDQAMS